jgi:uncharacterized protein
VYRPERDPVPVQLPTPSMALGTDLLLVGNSVRYLAESGHRAGLALAGLDGYADQDTRAACAHCDASPPADPRWAERAAALAAPGQVRWTYGAGFEASPDDLGRLERQYGAPLGNDPGLFALLADPVRWFGLLERLGIRYPETRFDAADDPAGWLEKSAAGCGGLAVRRAGHQIGHQIGHRVGNECIGDMTGTGPRVYQRYLRGALCSLTFAADGRAMMPFGFNRLHACFPAAGDFRFAGVVSGYLPGREQAATMLAVARRLTVELGLRGINGIDFVIHRGQPRLLDLNARPPASLELYEERLRHGGLVAHLDASSGRLPVVRPDDGARGLRILYARCRPGALPATWPDWLRDRPVSVAAVEPDQPLCSIHASARTPEAVEALLRERADQARALFADTGRADTARVAA